MRFVKGVTEMCQCIAKQVMYAVSVPTGMYFLEVSACKGCVSNSIDFGYA